MYNTFNKRVYKTKVCPVCQKKMHHPVLKKNRIITKDHILLKSLGGVQTNQMCNHCNELRGNKFAEQAEFIEWFNNGKPPMQYEKNFSYLTENPAIVQAKKDAHAARAKENRQKRHKFSFASTESSIVSTVSIASTESKSTLIDSYVKGDKLIKVYKHPLYGTSNVVEDLEIETN